MLLFAAAPDASAAWPPPTPAQISLSVRNTSAVDRNELVRGGVPLPRALSLTHTGSLAIVDQNGVAVPAAFQVLARWNAPRNDNSAPIQWLLVRFLASMPAGGTRSFTLRTDGSIVNPAPQVVVTVAPDGSGLRVDTGIARFVVGSDLSRVFDRIERPILTPLASSQFSSTINGNAANGFGQARRVIVEHADALSATIIVEGVYGHANVGNGGISGGRRLEFAAGSGAVSVREWIDWEGQRCAVEQLDCGNGLNAVSLDRWRVQLLPTLGAGTTLTMQASEAAPPASVSVAPGDIAMLRQLRRSDRQQPQRFELALPGQPLRSGARADRAVALLSGSAGALGVTIGGMADYEPQALRLLANGALALDLADDAVWLAARQGAFATYRVGAYAPGTSFAAAGADLWPALNAPLTAMPTAEWIAASRATDEFPIGTLPPALAGFDTALDDLIDRTIELRRDRGLEGLTTFGLYPRNWGNPVLSDEIDCGPGQDPTPGNDWDDPFWCATWTDYHNTTAMAVIAAWRHADPAPIHHLARPAALRSLHTQMLRCAPSDGYFYCGQFPTGYGGYRVDFNSSHAYVENLILYYWLSGDRTVIERLQRGANTMRGYLCPGRGSTPPGPICSPTTPISDEFAGVNDRVASQFYQIFRFVGLASDDASFLDDWRSNTARFLTQNFALVQQGGQLLGFTEPSGAGSTTIIGGPGSYYSTQLWMASIYDFNLLHRLQIDTQDAPLGLPAVTPSAAQQGFARALRAIGQTPPGNGSAAGTWPNTVRFTFSGARIGGNLTALEPGWVPNSMPQPCFDDCLYDTGKSPLSAVFARAADETGDPQLRASALDFALLALQSIATTPQPMSKSSGELFGRLTAAVARLAADESVFGDGFE